MLLLIEEISYRIGNKLPWIGINMLFWVGLISYRIGNRLSL